jgi:gliding motility-associated-like protein
MPMQKGFVFKENMFKNFRDNILIITRTLFFTTMKKIAKSLIAALFIAFICPSNSTAQVDTEFWFVVPETVEWHREIPVAFRFRAYDQPATITINMPANDGFTSITLNVAANQSVTHEIPDRAVLRLWENGTLPTPGGIVDQANSDWVSFADAKNPSQGKVLKKGLHITSTAPISGYYEVANGNNPEKFILKGANALGTNFWVPSQTSYESRDWRHNPPVWVDVFPREQINIVATDDNTQVTFTLPSHGAAVGHAAGQSHTITLNRGETYCIRSTSYEIAHHFGGTQITSTKPIAVTISDDSINHITGATINVQGETRNNLHGNYDLVGDQLIPVNVIGSKYVAVNTMFGITARTSRAQRVFILAITNNTTITISKPDGTSDSFTLNAGEQKWHDFLNHHSILITSDTETTKGNDFYVYQFASVDYELGSAILPKIECTGSSSVTISPIYDANVFSVQVIARKRDIPSFTASLGSMQTDLRTLNNWRLVPGTGNDENSFYVFIRNYNNLTTGATYTINNTTGLFHLGVLDANGMSMSYGYFSSYQMLRIEGEQAACANEQIVLSVNVPEGSALKWFYRNDEILMQEIATDVTSITIDVNSEHRNGFYWVEFAMEGCDASDEMEVQFIDIDFDLGENRAICLGEEIEWDFDFDEQHTYSWTINGAQVSTSNAYTFNPSEAGEYDIRLVISNTLHECSPAKEIKVTVNSIPEFNFNVTNNGAICLGEQASLVVSNPGDYSYVWTYRANATATPTIVGENSNVITPQASGIYSVVVTSAEECSRLFDLNLTVNPLPLPSLADYADCPNTSHTFSLTGFSSYAWTLGDDATPSDAGNAGNLTLNQPGAVSVIVTNQHGCVGQASAAFTWHNQHVFDLDTDYDACEGQAEKIVVIDDTFINYQWFFESESGNPRIAVTPGAIREVTAADHTLTILNAGNDQAGTYFIEAQDNINNCPVRGEFVMTIDELPEIVIDGSDFTGFCSGESLEIVVVFDNDKPFDGDGYTWYKDGVVMPEQNTNRLFVTDNGVYQASGVQSSGCLVSTQLVTVVVVDAPEFGFAPTNMVCPGEEFELRVIDYAPGRVGSQVDTGGTNTNNSIPATIRWMQGALIVEDDELFYNTIEEATFDVTVTDHWGCSTTETITTEYFDVPEINLDDVEFCRDGQESYTLLIPPGLEGQLSSYRWFHVEEDKYEDSNDPMIAYSTGTYLLFMRTNHNVLDAEGNIIGCPVTAEMTLVINENPGISLGNDRPACENTTIGISASPSFTSYAWNHDGVLIDGETTRQLTVSQSGLYSLTVIDEKGCEGSTNVTITVHQPPTISIGPDREFCSDEEFTLSIEPNVSYLQVLWHRAGNVQPINQGVNSIRVNGSGHITASIIDINNCRAQASASVTSFPNPDVSLGSDVIVCPDAEIITVSASPADYQRYVWHDGTDGNTTEVEAVLVSNINTVRVFDGRCWGFAQKSVNIHSEPELISGGDFDACEPEEILLEGGVFSSLLYDGYDEYTYTWSGNNNNLDWSGSEFRATETGKYVVAVSDGCYTLTDTFNVVIHSSPQIVALDTTFYAQVTVLTDPDRGTQPFVYTLNESQGQPENTFKNVPNGESTIWLEDANGCETFISFDLDSGYQLEIPKFITPNGDGHNDVFIIHGLERLPESVIRIYDRYGKLIVKYLAADFPWDGTYLNRPVASDDYWFVVELKPVNKVLRGSFTVKH